MNEASLAVTRWSAWSFGLGPDRNWQVWSKDGLHVQAAEKPDVQFVKPILRRRLNPLTRMAFRVSADCLAGAEAAQDAGRVGVFCSRFGEFGRAFEMLGDLAAGAHVSPASFSLSVHNTIASLFSIHRQDTAPYTAVAAGETSLEAGFLEAWSLLRDGTARSVLLVYCDDPLPEFYATQAEGAAPLAIALLLTLPEASPEMPCLALSWARSDAEEPERQGAPTSPLDLIPLLLRRRETMRVSAERLTWSWYRHAAVA
ncbi:MAG: beta-ketoacyl synthase chain length factor [Thalassobaculaceae bacterium]|nr:beta-ketoacyl synthase chain length factor [Thalassobaculaceae bacterium]